MAEGNSYKFRRQAHNIYMNTKIPGRCLFCLFMFCLLCGEGVAAGADCCHEPHSFMEPAAYFLVDENSPTIFQFLF